jgi:hypothetical protein
MAFLWRLLAAKRKTWPRVEALGVTIATAKMGLEGRVEEGKRNVCDREVVHMHIRASL